MTVRENEGAEQEYLFACNSWLDDHMEDRQTQRQLQLLGELLTPGSYRRARVMPNQID